MYGFKPQHARGKPVQNYADGGLVNPLAGVGEYWSNSNAEFEAQNPNLLQRGVRAINPVTGFGSAVGAMHDGASVGSARDMAIAAMQAVPVFGAMRAVAPAVKTVAGAAPAVLVPSMAKTAARVAKGAAAGVAADKAQAQNFADGGIVHSIKGALGFRPRTPEELRAADAKSQARNQEAATAVAGRVQAAPDTAAPAKAISDYSGMLAMQRREKEQGLADGGTVKPRGFVVGKGTGTSDSIPARLSNGEYVLPADTVKAVGVEALDSLRAATHTPVKHEQAKAARGFFAGGTPGGVDEEKRKNSFGDAAAVARDSSVAQVGGLANNGGADASRFATVPAPIGTQPNRPPEPATPAAPVPAAPAPGASASQSLAQRVSQIPTGAPPGGPTAPATTQSPGGVPEWVSGSETGRNIWNAANALPGVAGALPVIARTGGAITSGIDAATRLLNAGVGAAAISAIPGAASAQGSTPSTIASPPTSQTNPAAAPASTSLANAGRGVVNPPTINPSAPAPSNAPAAAPEVMPGVYQHGRGQYSDNASGMGSTSVPGSGGQGSPVGKTVEQAQREGLVGERVGYNPAYDQRLNGATGISAQNMGAADALAGRSQQESMSRVTARGMGALAGGPGSGPVEPGSFTGGYSGVIGSASTYGNMRGRSPEQRLRDAEVSASSIMNRPQWGGRGAENSASMLEYRAALAQDANIRQNQAASELEAMRQNAGITREGMQQEGATTRTGIQEQGSNARAAVSSALQRDEFGLKKEAAGFQTRAAARLENLQTRHEAEKDPAKRSELAQQLRELQVKDAPARYKVAAGGQQIDANGVAYRTPDRIFNEQTGVFSDGAGAAPAPQALPPKEQLKAGQTYQTPRGPARWNGKQFTTI